ncbi:MAG: hypothetical protein IV088_16170 [Hydrogenophaga sp.]|uniref:Ig-like domain-containing protein n=1 Tax=Hydrogenophaga sp. TaxID=1904254 RepID=UPI0025BD68EA|nr:Ig-like domain-containing protein [Hydrogenophaga sp.]MBT9552387.1 hypothetical protein [Hydrogenophaga sp.]
MNTTSLLHPVLSSLHRSHSMRRQLLKRGAAATALMLSLTISGCGGGSSTDGPTVTLATTPTSAPAGATVTLIAVASSDIGISEVKFYRVGSSSNTLLGTLYDSPYQFTTTLPSSATDSVTYFARAEDDDGNTTDSEDASVTITD